MFLKVLLVFALLYHLKWLHLHVQYIPQMTAILSATIKFSLWVLIFLFYAFYISQLYKNF